MFLVCWSSIKVGKSLRVALIVGSMLMIVVKGDVANISATEILQMEQSLKSDKDVGGFKLRQLYSYHVRRKLLILGGYCCGEREISWSR